MVFYRISKSAHSESGNSFLLRCLLFARNTNHPKRVQYEAKHKSGLQKIQKIGTPFPAGPIAVAGPFHLSPVSHHTPPPDAPEI